MVLASQIRRFFDFEVDTITELVKDGETEFPTITICNMQICGFKDYNATLYFEEHAAEESEKNPNAKEILEEKLRRNKTKSSFFLAREIFLHEYNYSELTRIMSRNTAHMSDMLIRCAFDGVDCGPGDFEFLALGEFSKCYKFNSNAHANKRAKKYKKNNGLRLELYIGNQEECK